METDIRHAVARQDRCIESPGLGRFAGLLAVSIMLLAATTQRATAKSMYVIASIVSFDGPIPIQAYDIGSDGRLAYQATFGAPFIGAGMRGIAMDADSGHLFCTYENSSYILAVDATALQQRAVLSVGNATNLAGITYDHKKKQIYCAELATSTLYAMTWDPIKGMVKPAVGSPYTLKGAEIYGITMDEYDDLLYVASPGQGIAAYSTWDWRLVQTWSPGRIALNVAVDPQRGYAYSGGGFADNYYLTQIKLSDKSTREVLVDTEAGVLGLGVDQDTGLVYITTGRDNRPGGKDLMVFNTDLELVQTIEDIGRPTGLVIPNRTAGFNPLELTMKVKNPLGGKPNSEGQYYIVIGDLVTYTICFDSGGYDLSGIVLTDQLPVELTFVDATGHGTFGQYDPTTHTYRWQRPPMTPGTVTCLELVCRLQSHVPAGKIVTNRATVDSDQTSPSTVSTGAIATAATFNPLNLRKTVVFPEPVDDGKVAYAGPGEQVTYRICFDNLDNDRATGPIAIVDILPRQLQFVSATGDGLFGSYDSASHTYTWIYPSLAARASDCVDLTGRLTDNLAAGTVITNRATIQSSETPEMSDGMDLTVAYAPVEVQKSVVSPVGETDDRGRPCVGVGDEITYAIRLRNPSRDVAVTQVMAVDKLPPELTFVRADGDRDYGFYDSTTHTYTWQHPLLTAGGEFRVQLVAKVKDPTVAGAIISNVVTVSSQQAAPSQARAEVAVCTGSVPCEMFLKPTRIWRNQPETARELMVVVHLPVGYGMETIVDAPLTLTPGNVPSSNLRIYGTGEQGKILCFFDTAAILKATEGYGEFAIRVTGTLKGGRSLVADGSITILMPPNP